MPNYEAAARRAAAKYGIDPAIFVRMLRQESGLTPGKTSPKGAQGIAQFIPSTAKAYGVNLNDNRVTDDLEGAARYLRDNLQRTGGNYHQALSIYNSGRPEGYKSIPETSNYVRSILSGVGGASARGTFASGSGPRTVTTRRTIPGVDNSQERRGLILDWLQNRHNPQALVGLAQGLQGAQDVPSRTVSSTRQVKGQAASASEGRRSPLLELFYNGPGGINAKNGQREPRGFVSGHTDHVHVAAGPKTVVGLGELAQQMGLHVGENPHFGGVNPVHVARSYHYRGQAIDVSGPAKLMERFDREVARRYGLAR